MNKPGYGRKADLQTPAIGGILFFLILLLLPVLCHADADKIYKENSPAVVVVASIDQDGKLIGQGLPWSSFRCGLHPVAVSTLGRVGLAASKDRIGVLLPDCHEWVEFNLGGELSGRWSWRDVPITNGLESSAMSSAVAMTASNEVFARIGIGLYRLNREQGAWNPVDLGAATGSGAMFSWLAGNDGESLIYTTGRELIWANATKQ